MKRTGLARIRPPDRQATHPAALRRAGGWGECAVPADLGDTTKVRGARRDLASNLLRTRPGTPQPTPGSRKTQGDEDAPQ